MDDALTIEAVLKRGLDGLLNPAPARRKAAAQLPEIVARSLRGQMDGATRAQLAERLTTEIWPAVRKERGERWDLGWAELTAGIALAVELLQGDLPRGLHAEFQGTPAEQAWRHARQPFQRFVLLVDSSVHVRRVFATVRSRQPGVPVERSQEWAVDGPPFRDRSHTLMLALMADGALPEDAGPVAATGELLEDGERVGPVGGLVEKTEAWRRLYPDGLLISAPPGDLDPRTWAALARPSTRSPGDREPNWVVGATLREITVKLRPANTTIASWDGTPLAEDAVLEARLAPHDANFPEQPFSDPLLDAAWAAFREARSRGQRRGVVIHGIPGSGKSVLSTTLERRFARGVLGAFGLGVRRSARDLAADIERAPSRTWSTVLALRDRERTEILDALDATQRLVPIVDGLDELQPEHLQGIADWLRTGRGWWIATSRPFRGTSAELPPAWELRLQDLGRNDARRLLVALGRADLADAAMPIGSQATMPATVQELTRTPLHTALLAKVVPPGQDLRRFEPHALYEGAFEGLLDHACRSGRLRAADAGLVRRLLTTVIGELALAWLQSADGLLDRGAVDGAFDGVEMGPLDQVRAVEALAFGHLLVPVGATWEFGHRTMAEWAAAAALRRRVERGLRTDGGLPDGRASSGRRAQVELDVLGPFLGDDVLPHQSRWATLLRFYARFVKEPIAVLDRMLGPARVTNWRTPEHRSRWDGESTHERQILRKAESTEVLESWSFAYEILRLCRWTQAAEARAAWALAARRWLLTGFDRSRQVAPDGFWALRGFSDAVAEHLPETLDELVELAARTEAQRAQLTTDPLVLLPAIPAVRASSLADLLEHGTRAQQLSVIEWHAERGVGPSRSVLDRLAGEIPDELDRALQDRAARWDERPDWEGHARGPDDGDVLVRLEAAVWSAFPAHGSEPPWAVVRRRFAAWPSHLDKQLTEWFGIGLAPDTWSSPREDGHRRRRELLASLLDQASHGEKKIAGILAAIEDVSERSHILGRVRYFFNDSDDRHLQRIVEGIVSALGWKTDQSWEPREIAKEQVAATVRQTVIRVNSLRTRASRLVGALDDAALDGVVGELWTLLAPDHPDRREILLALDGRDCVPRKVPAAEVVRHRGGASWRLDRIRWTADHLEQLRQVSRAGAGRARYEAACALARATGRDELTELLQHLPSDDETFASLVYEHLASRSPMGDEGVAPGVPDPSRLPLPDRAAQNLPGWRAELLARLAGDDVDELTALADMSVRHEVREALPLLAQRLTGDDWRDRRLVEAIALLATDRDEEAARVALAHALRVGWPDGRTAWSPLPRDGDGDTTKAGVALARFLRVEDLDVLADGGVSALRHPSLAAAIRALGSAAIGRLVALHEAAARRVAEIESASGAAADSATLLPRPPVPELEQARKRRDALAETIVASLDPSAASPKDVVDLLFRIVHEDVHHVYGIPGPLGSDFDEPGDMDWHSDQENEALVKAAARAIEESLGHHAADWGALRRLLSHPSESLRKRAFELCADRAEPHEVAALAIDALDGHVQENRTRWTGQTAGLLLAGHQSGAGSVYVESPDTARSLVATVRARLTPAHKEVVRELATHPLPVFRRLAAQWAGELGAADWVELVVPMLEDGDAGVVWAALGAVAALAPSGVDASLGDLRCGTWTAEHDAVLLSRLRPARDALVLLRPDRGEGASLAVHVGEATLVRLLSGAADRAAAPSASQGARDEASCFRGFLSLVESVLSEWPRPLGPEIVDVFRAWIDHPKQLVREVGRRQLAIRGLLDLTLLESLLVSASPADRFSGAECVVRMSVEALRSAGMRVLRGALAESPGEDDYRAVAIEPPKGGAFGAWPLRSDQLGDPPELRRRVLWALRGATPAFAEALALVANRLPYDEIESCLEPEGEKIVRDVTGLIRRWGPEGAVAVLGLIDRGEVEDDYTFLSEIRQASERHGSVLAAVRDGAARGAAASTALLKELNDGEFDRDLAGLARRLTEDVFPPGWPEPSAWK